MKFNRFALTLLFTSVLLAPQAVLATPLGGVINKVDNKVDNLVSQTGDNLGQLANGSGADVSATVNNDQLAAGATVTVGGLANLQAGVCSGNCQISDNGNGGGNDNGGGNNGGGNDNGGGDNGGSNSGTDSTSGTSAALSSQDGAISASSNDGSVAYNGNLEVTTANSPTMVDAANTGYEFPTPKKTSVLGLAIAFGAAVLAGGAVALKQRFPELSLDTVLWDD